MLNPLLPPIPPATYKAFDEYELVLLNVLDTFNVKTVGLLV